MVKNILIPTDGSEYEKAAIDYGIFLANALGASLRGLHVVDVRLLQGPLLTDLAGSLGPPPYHELLPAMKEGLEAKAEAILTAFLSQCRAAGVEAEAKKAAGVVEEVIIEEARTSCDLIILAQQGENFRLGGGAIIGSTTKAVVCRSGKPVLVTPASFHPVSRMTLAYDGSKPAHKALKIAAELARTASWPLSVIIITDDEDTARQRQEQAEALLAAVGTKSAVEVLSGRKEDKELLRYIASGSTDLLVMGAYGHNQLRGLLLGSTTAAVIKKSPIPVLLTR